MHGIVAFNGTIDAAYRGIICVVLFNFSDDDCIVEKGNRIVQIIIQKCYDAKFFDYGERLERLESERESKGFGSSSRFKKKKKMELNKEEATKQLHFDILNTVLKIIDKCWYYCFCKKYQDCEWFDGGQSFCPRFKICFDFNDIENRCNFPQFKFDELMTI